MNWTTEQPKEPDQIWLVRLPGVVIDLDETAEDDVGFLIWSGDGGQVADDPVGTQYFGPIPKPEDEP